MPHLFPGFSGSIISVAIIGGMWIFRRTTKKFSTYNLGPGGNPLAYEPIMSRYIRLAELMVGVGTISVIFLVASSAIRDVSSGRIAWIFASPMIIIAASVLYGICFIASQILTFEEVLHGNPHTANSYALNETLGFSGLLCFIVGYIWLIFAAINMYDAAIGKWALGLSDEVTKTLIEKILGWPIAIIVICLLFRRPLGTLLGRISGFTAKLPGGSELNASLSASAQNKPSTQKEDQLASLNPIQALLPLEEPLKQRRELVKTRGMGVETVSNQVADIKSDLAKLQFLLNTDETTEVLIRQLAVTQLALRAETTYRLIFGSQIRALQMLNEFPSNEASIQPIYEKAVSDEPEFYQGYSFQNWLDFLLKQSLIINQNSKYAITLYGKDFLVWFIAGSLPTKAH
jgi:hypothetical protein